MVIVPEAIVAVVILKRIAVIAALLPSQIPLEVMADIKPDPDDL
jgi:hypothetical protein